MKIALLDIFFLAILAFFVIRVTVRGFVAEFFSKAAVIGGGLAAVLFYKPLTPIVVRMLGPKSFAGLIAFLLIFLLTYLVVKIVQAIVGSALRIETLSNLDKALGFFLGIIEGFIIIMIMLIILTMQPFFDVQTLLQESICFNLLFPLIIHSQSLLHISMR